ncbi:MAG TPA: hypothetical protein VF030_02800 [Solirubrobacterales bacterium]
MQQHEPNQSRSDAPGTGDGASRFWSQYSASRPPRGEPRSETRNGGSSASEQAHEHECLEWCPICRGAEVVRATTPPELREQVQAVQRDVLLILRGVIDAYLQRGVQHPPPPHGPHAQQARQHGVEDIPID